MTVRLPITALGLHPGEEPARLIVGPEPPRETLPGDLDPSTHVRWGQVGWGSEDVFAAVIGGGMTTVFPGEEAAPLPAVPEPRREALPGDLDPSTHVRWGQVGWGSGDVFAAVIRGAR